MAAGVVEPAMSKVKQLRFATEAAITILRIDDFIKVRKWRAGLGVGRVHNIRRCADQPTTVWSSEVNAGTLEKYCPT